MAGTLLDIDTSKDYYNTIIGNPVSCSDGIVDEVRDLVVHIEPIQAGSGDPSPTNVRAISGVSSVTVTRTGRNIANIANLSVTVNNWYYEYFTNVRVAPGIYTLSFDAYTTVEPTITEIYLHETLTDPTIAQLAVSSLHYNGRVFVTFTVTEERIRTANSTRLMIRFPRYNGPTSFTASITNIQLEIGETATDYAPYQGASVTVPLVDSNNNPLTVYGGTLDVMTGMLTVTHVILTENDFNRYTSSTIQNTSNLYFYDTASPDDIIDKDLPTLCNKLPQKTGVLGWNSQTPCISTMTQSNGNIILRAYVASANITAFRQDYAGLQVVYPLSSPTVYQLAPSTISTLLGTNVFSSSNGQVQVTYRMDPTQFTLPS